MLHQKKPVALFLASFVIIAMLSGCATTKSLAIKRDISAILKNSEVFSSHFTGFSLYDLDQQKFIINHNADLAFTPASNTKLLTMYAVLKTFGDSIPAVLIDASRKQPVVRPVGDPTFLYPPFTYQPLYTYLTQLDTVLISWPETEPSPYGSGWAWDDYLYDFQPQRSWWPIFGNTVSITKEDSLIRITPPFFTKDVEIILQEKGEQVHRDLKYNLFQVFLENDTSSFDRTIPFEYSVELFKQLLSDTLNTSVIFTDSIRFTPTDTLYAQHSDTVVARMMKPSDNFLAEQLLLMTAWKNGYEEIKPFIIHVKTNWLGNLGESVWVDGSGLSRYNLIAPLDQVRLLQLMINEFGWERVSSLLPTGGEGTLEAWYLAEAPFIYAKTGTLSNNHNLSGLLVTQSGKRLVFSFMNNHYLKPTKEIKEAMERLIRQIHVSY